MSSLVPTVPTVERPPLRARLRLRGLTWLIWRQHRASFRIWAVCAVVLTGYLVYLHATYASYLSTQGRNYDSDLLSPDAGFSVASLLLYTAPLLSAAAFGAQLFEREYTEGTFALVCVQSVSPTAWVRTKLLVPAAMVLLCVTPCAVAFTWDYDLDPYRKQILLGHEVFECSGPSVVALTMVGFLVGAACGLILRRNGAAPGLSLVLVLAFKLLLSGLASLLNQDPQSATWKLQWTTTAICALACAGLARYCRHLILQRPS